jgi:multicomponent K+:H+ antiporter subunit D
VATAAQGGYHVYRMGDWAVPFGIVLVLDRLSAMMVLLTALVGTGSLLHAVQGAEERGPHFHALFQLQIAGLNGAFLTGDLFNLFVFFEILLIASYCLLVHGATAPRVRWGVHYVVLNLVGSSLFLIAIGALYGLTGTLNLADLARRVAVLPTGDAGPVRAAALLLFVVFALKAALAPLHFWLPNAYAAASAPVAALFAVMTKVGVYAIVRVFTLVFGPGAGVAAQTVEPWLLPIAVVTIALATLGALGATELRRLQGYLLVSSVGFMLAGLHTLGSRGVAAALFYLVHSTLVTAAMFLVADLLVAGRGPAAGRLAGRPPLPRRALPGALFFLTAVGIAGIPPLPGFIGKALILAAADGGAASAWVWASVLGASALSIVALGRAGVAIFWAPSAPVAGAGDDGSSAAPAGSPRGPSVVPATVLLALVVLLAVLAGPVSGYTAATGAQLTSGGGYMGAVLGTPGGR